MIINITSLIILGVSFLGLVFLVYRKVPAINALPQNEAGNLSNELVSHAKNIAGKIPVIKSFSLEVFLQKILSQVRIVSLKTDHKTFDLLQKLREKNQKKRLENDTYWDELKNSTTDLKKK